MQKITPFLWFDSQAEDAAKFYTAIFKNSKIIDIARYAEGSPGAVGSVMTVQFELNGQRFVALNGGPHYKITPAISFMVNCDSQTEIDYFWSRFAADGQELQCGWITDKFGVSWQVIPSNLGDLLDSDHPGKAAAVMKALMGMIKLDMNVLQKAHDET
jgi:predicted 3-demethylubiquinone-9 3-methyltransferase (glyoxalase superfamily)